MKDPGWLTKAEAAAVLGVDERTIERRARAGRISARARPGFPTLYREADVEILKQTAPGEVQTGLLEPVPPASSNGHGRMATVRGASSPIEPLVVQVLQALLGALAHGPTGPTDPTDAPTGPTLTPEERAAQYVTLKEAAAIKRLPQVDLRALCHDGDLPHRVTSRGGIRIRRKDLEQL